MLSPLNQSGHTKCEPSCCNEGNIRRSNSINLLANNSGVDCKLLEANDPIYLINKFSSMLPEEKYKPCEDGEIYEEDLTSSGKNPELGIGRALPPNNLSQKKKYICQKVDFEDPKLKSLLD